MIVAPLLNLRSRIQCCSVGRENDLTSLFTVLLLIGASCHNIEGQIECPKYAKTNSVQAMTIQKHETQAPKRSPNIAPARDGNIAIKQEFDAAVVANEKHALELFLLRHPGHELATKAAIILKQKYGPSSE